MPVEQSNVCICAGHVVFFSDDVSEQAREDILNSSLYFQLAAGEKYSRFKELEEWRGVSKELMTLFGWIITQEKSLDDSSDEVFILDINRTLGKMLNGKVPAPLLARFDTFCHELDTAASSRADMTLLLKHALCKIEDAASVNGRPGAIDTLVSLLISFVCPEGGVITVLVSSTAPVHGNQEILPTHFAFDRLVGSFSLSILHIEFMERKYARVRDRVTAELAERTSSQIIVYPSGTHEV